MFSFEPLTLTDILEMVGIISTFITSIIAITISVKTLKQNSKMIEDSTRPYICMYVGTTYFSSLRVYLIIKNYGSSSARITDFSCSYDLSLISLDENRVPFSNIIGSNLCPGETLHFLIDNTKLCADTKLLNVQITYKTDQHTYSETCVINFAAFFDAPYIHKETKNDVKEISFALQNIVEKML